MLPYLALSGARWLRALFAVKSTEPQLRLHSCTPLDPLARSANRLQVYCIQSCHPRLFQKVLFIVCNFSSYIQWVKSYWGLYKGATFQFLKRISECTVLDGAFLRRENGRPSRAGLGWGRGGTYGQNVRRRSHSVPTLTLGAYCTCTTLRTPPYVPCPLHLAHLTRLAPALMGSGDKVSSPWPFYLLCSLKIRFLGNPVADLVGNSDIDRFKTYMAELGDSFAKWSEVYYLHWEIWSFTCMHSSQKL